GGRNDILQAAARWAQMCAEKGIAPTPESADEYFAQFLLTDGLPDPDIMIRTSGEQRISNFLLWQGAYAEMVFTPTLWPDFTRADMEAAIREYAGRDRRFGAVGAK
ncbi:MAG TPA: undecaprenyl diphosphate synthase family protein, partial [Alphaproteobacteria bacterium]